MVQIPKEEISFKFIINLIILLRGVGFVVLLCSILVMLDELDLDFLDQHRQ